MQRQRETAGTRCGSLATGIDAAQLPDSQAFPSAERSSTRMHMHTHMHILLSAESLWLTFLPLPHFLLSPFFTLVSPEQMSGEQPLPIFGTAIASAPQKPQIDVSNTCAWF